MVQAPRDIGQFRKQILNKGSLYSTPPPPCVVILIDYFLFHGVFLPAYIAITEFYQSSVTGFGGYQSLGVQPLQNESKHLQKCDEAVLKMDKSFRICLLKTKLTVPNVSTEIHQWHRMIVGLLKESFGLDRHFLRLM